MVIEDTQENQALHDASNLTRSQFLIWIGQKLNPEAPLYNMALTYQIDGHVDIDAFRQAFQKVIDESDAMRTVVEEIDGIPFQRVLPHLSYSVDLLDFRHKADPLAACDTWAEHRCQTNFKLNEYLFESTLIRIADDKIFWYMNQHHLVVDAWSISVVFKRVSELYPLVLEGRHDQAPGRPSFKTYRRYESDFRNSKSSQRALDYWQKKTATALDAPSFYGQPLLKTGTRSERVYCELGVERSQKLREIALEDGIQSLSSDITVFNIFATLLFTWQYRVTQQRNLSIGTFAHNRNSDEFKATIGMFIELFPLYASIDDGETFTSLILKLGKESLGFLAHAQAGTGNPHLEHPYGVILNFINASFSDFAGLSVRSRWVHPGHGDRGHALRLQVHDFDNSGNFQLHFDFNKEVFSGDLRRFATHHFMQIVDAFIENRNMRLNEIDLLGPKDRHYVLEEFNQPADPNPPGNTIIDLFEAQVADSGGATAIEFNENRLSYRALDQQSTTLAVQLAHLGFGRGHIAAIFCERSVDLVVAILAVLKTAGAYLPIDPTYPRERIAMLLDDADTKLVLTHSVLEPRLPENCNTVVLDDTSIHRGKADKADLLVKPLPEDRAYIMYTSGSTGKPKGVVIEHRALINYLVSAKKQYVGDENYSMPLFSTISADLTVTSLFLPLVCGGKIVVYQETQAGVDLSILKVIEDDMVDIVKLTPSHLALLKEKSICNSQLKTLIVGGEDLKTVLARTVLDMFEQDINVYNEYGPTEATVGCMTHRFDPDTDISTSVPIGKPVDNMQVYLLDENLKPVPFGFEGEIYIAGAALAAGYLNRSELTLDRFVDNPFSSGSKMYRTGDLARWTIEGILDYSGREDHQVKINGFRIELGEVEAALNAHPLVTDSVVTVIGQTAAAPVEVRHCLDCGLESTHPDAKMDTDGICQICRDFKHQKQEAQLYFKSQDDLLRLFTDIKTTRSGNYDCIMLLSGGKDSTYVLYQLVAMGLTPLVFSLDNGYISEQAKTNVNNVVASLGLELVWGTTPAMNDIFVDSLKRFSNVCNGCHKVIYTLSVNLALEKGIRYIVTGLSRGQFFETRVSPFFKNNIFASSQIDSNIVEARKAYHRMDDAVSRCMDVSAFQDDDVFNKVEFIDFYRYTDVKLEEMLEFLKKHTAWVRPKDTGRSTNCQINEAGIYVHKKERSFHNYSLPYSWDVRLGHKQRDAALNELDDNIDEINVQRILGEIGYTDAQQVAEEKRLAAYFTSYQDISGPALREFLALSLPAHMLPSYFMSLDSIPLSPAGKKDRNALPAPGKERNKTETAYLEPRNEMEALLVDIWESVMRIENIGVNDNFFDLGGDSISNIQIVARINQQGLMLKSEQLFSHPTISELASVLSAADIVEPALESMPFEIPDAPGTGINEQQTTTLEERSYNLSPLQQGILFHTISAPDSGIYVEQYYCELRGSLEVSLFQRAWEMVVDRHAALRTAILWEQEEKPIQVEKTDIDLSWELLDWRTATPPEQQSHLETWLIKDSQKGFDLSQAPLTRFALMQLDGNSWQFVWSFHHIVLDGWSSQLVLKDAYDFYHAMGQGDTLHLPPMPSYRRYVEALQQQNQNLARSYWKETLKGFTDPTCPRDYDATAQIKPSVEKYHFDVPGTLGTNLRVFARQNNLTLNTLIQGAWAITLGNYTSKNDVVFGATVSGRQLALDSINEMTGLFINTLPVRVSLTTTKTVCEWLQELQENQIRMREFESSALIDIQKWSDVSRGTELFDTLFVFENYALLAQVNEELSFRSSEVNYRDQSNFALTIVVIEDDDLKLVILYDSGKFTSAFIQRLVASLETVLQAFTNYSTSALESLPVLSTTEFQQYLVNQNNTEADFSVETSIHQMIEAQAAKQPAKPALMVDNEVLSYSELNKKTNQLARELQKRRVVAGHLIGLHLVRSTDMVIAMLAVLKTGAAYVPLDPDYPSERLDLMLRDGSIALVLSQSFISTGLPPTTAEIINLDTAWGSIAQNPDSNPECTVDANELAYIMYTSGSTGKPKGVMVSHRNVVNSTRARLDYYHPVQRFLLLSSISFDSSVAGIYWTLCQGGCLHIPDQQRFKEADHLVQLIQHYKITHLLCIPTLWQQLLDLDGLSSLDTVIVAGEVCPAGLPEKHHNILPATKLYNEFGPTEGTVWSTVFDCSNSYQSKSVPIGYPVSNVKVFVLDELLRPTPIGVTGELYIGGAGVAHGYLNLPKQTAEHFILPPPELQTTGKLYKSGDMVRFLADGALEFLGRKDQQIKLRGYRIELGEIEAVLSEHPRVNEAVVVVNTGDAVFHGNDDPLSAQFLEHQLNRLGEEEALSLLAQAEKFDAGPAASPRQSVDENLQDKSTASESIDTSDFRVELHFKHEKFISPPRKTQRNWLIYQQLAEIKDDLKYLDHVSKTFVPGKGTHLDALDVSAESWSRNQIMEDWQTPLMKAMANDVSQSHGDVLEIGYGRGVSAELIQQCGVKSHTIIEANPDCIERYFKPWRVKHSGSDIRLVTGMWQDVLPQLETYDGVFFHTFPMNEEEFVNYVMDSVTFAEHFFPIAASLLRPGGVFSYLTTEIDSLSRRHQRALFKHFSRFTVRVEPLNVPVDTADTWWAESMVVIQAFK